MEKERQRKLDCVLTKGNKMHLHHFDLILHLEITPNYEKSPLAVYLQQYFWNTVSAQCKIQPT